MSPKPRLQAFMTASLCSLIGLSAGCAHTLTGERTAVAFEPRSSLLVVLERKTYSIVNRPEGGFYENGIIGQQLKLEQELKTTFPDQLAKRGVTSEFMGIPAVLGGVTEEALSWNSAIDKDKFPYMLALSPGGGVVRCRSGGFDCVAAFALDLRVVRRSDALVLWKGAIKSVEPPMLTAPPESPSSLMNQLLEKLSAEGIITAGQRN